MVHAQPEGPIPVVSGDTTPAVPEPRRSGQALLFNEDGYFNEVQLGAGVYRRNRRHLKNAGPNPAAEEVVPDELPTMEDGAMVHAQPEGPIPVVSGDTTPAVPEPRRSGRAVRTPVWHQDYQIGDN
ncbi:hypothetical protein AWC38_SpisGene24739 [Stylophora pistillata]|uniref:Uncharacterized protein n=1 Tax=Stylophora pistillata TaxID=50429 RepID=A0A2B4R4S3_STYPI|nr:hypothetical protein AWC38_SpisGene24739 [Stylophora pistillata]